MGYESKSKSLFTLGLVGSVIYVAVFASALLFPGAIPPETEYVLAVSLVLFGLGFLGLYRDGKGAAALAAAIALGVFIVFALLRLSGIIATSTEIVALGRVLAFVTLLLMGASVLTTRDTNFFSVPAAVLFIVWGLIGLGHPLIYDIPTQLWDIGELVAVGLANLVYMLLQLR